jgi:hypothetical protein
MKSLDQMLAYESKTIDGRDSDRLLPFASEEQLKKMGYRVPKEDKGKRIIVPCTQENVLKFLKNDLSFSFKKALDKRGISSWLMFQVILMWMWVLEDPLAEFSYQRYPQYGLPLFKAVALKYGFPNPIGNDAGTENKYSENDHSDIDDLGEIS